MIEEINLIKKLENISSKFPNRLLKIEGYVLRKNSKEILEIIIYKGFSSSTTHKIEIDSEKNVINYEHYFTNFKLCKAPLNQSLEKTLKEKKNSNFFLDQKNWY